MASIYQTIHASPDETLPSDEQDSTIVEFNGDTGMWCAYDENGTIAVAQTFYSLFERMGNRWN